MFNKALQTLALCFSLSSIAHADPRSIIDAGDITDDPIVARDLVSGKAVSIEMNLGFLFDELANTTKGMRVDGDGLSGVLPTCAEVRKKINLPWKTTCYASIANKNVNIGADGEVNQTCTSKQVPYQVTEEVCEKICHGPVVNGNCAEPDILCRNKTVTKYRTVTTCKNQEYKVYFDSAGATPVDADTLKTHILVSRVYLSTDGTNAEKEAYAGNRYDVDSAAWLQMSCADGKVIGPKFTDFGKEQAYTYKQIHQICPAKKVYLKSNRALFFDVGTLNFYFDGY